MAKQLIVLLFVAALAMPVWASAQDQAQTPAPAPAPRFQAAPGPPPPPPGQFQGPGPGPGGPQWRGRGFGQQGGPGFRGRREFGPGFGAFRGGPRPGFGGSRGFRSRGGPGFGPGPGPSMLDERMRRELGLTGDQTKRLHELRLQTQKSAIRSRADLETKQLELQELLNAQTPDRAAIDRTIREIGDLHASQMKADIDMRLGLQSVLTPEQRKKMNDLRERRFNERVPGPGGPGGPGAPGRREQRTPARPRGQITPAPAPAPPQL